jgi:hypothetical protein
MKKAIKKRNTTQLLQIQVPLLSSEMGISARMLS